MTILQHYNRIANKNKAENEAEYKKWINSYKPEEIHLANNARHQLKRLSSGRTGKYTNLQDPRIPKQPGSPQSLFTRDRWSSGDFKGVKLADAAPRIAKEWKELSPSQRKVSSPVLRGFNELTCLSRIRMRPQPVQGDMPRSTRRCLAAIRRSFGFRRK